MKLRLFFVGNCKPKDLEKMLAGVKNLFLYNPTPSAENRPIVNVMSNEKAPADIVTILKDQKANALIFEKGVPESQIQEIEKLVARRMNGSSPKIISMNQNSPEEIKQMLCI